MGVPQTEQPGFVLDVGESRAISRSWHILEYFCSGANTILSTKWASFHETRHEKIAAHLY